MIQIEGFIYLKISSRRNTTHFLSVVHIHCMPIRYIRRGKSQREGQREREIGRAREREAAS